MFEFLLPEAEDHALAILKKDHDTVKELFGEFENAEDRTQKKRIAAQTLKELRIHTIIEEEIFYPALRGQLKKDIMNEADEEHHVAKLLVAELAQMDGSEDHYDSKYHVLAESVRHHIREEEEKMFPHARDLGLDFTAIGKQLLARKQELNRNGIPLATEDMMIMRHGKQDDSPAQAAHTRRRPVSAKSAKKTTKPMAKKTLVKKKAASAAKRVLPFKKTASAKKGLADHTKHVKSKIVKRNS